MEGIILFLRSLLKSVADKNLHQLTFYKEQLPPNKIKN